jgi:hypothetical protein
MGMDFDGEAETVYEERLEELGDISVDSLISLGLDLIGEGEGSFEGLCRAIELGESFLPMESDERNSEAYNMVYSRLATRAFRLRKETGEYTDADREEFVSVVECFSEYGVSASVDEIEEFLSGFNADWLSGLSTSLKYVGGSTY